MKSPWPKGHSTFKPDYPSQLWVVEYLHTALEVLDSVRHAKEDFESATTPARAKTAIRNFVEQSRCVTWTLENLKGTMTDPTGWDKWWNVVTGTLRSDPVCQWFYKFRNEVLKAGQTVRLENVVYIPAPMPPDIKGTMFESEWTEGPPQGSWVRVMGIPLEFETRPFIELMQRHIEVLQAVANQVTLMFWGEGELPNLRIPLGPGLLRYAPPPPVLPEIIQEMERRYPL